MAIEISGQNPAQLSNAKTDTTSEVGHTDPPVQRQQTGKPTTTDTVTLTDTASQLRKLESQIATVPIVDLSRVEGVKRSIVNGQFKIDSQRVADKMLNFETARNRLA
jgi:negative regulator of flagellin synthesis FlgM